MDDDFVIPVSYKGKELHFPARLLHFGYSYKIEVDVYETAVYFERDEEREWRVLVTPEDLETNKKIDRALIEQLIQSLGSILK
jgi:hypothetical protein